jgi:hypothetical protein
VTVRGVELPGRWVVVDRELRPVRRSGHGEPPRSPASLVAGCGHLGESPGLAGGDPIADPGLQVAGSSASIPRSSARPWVGVKRTLAVGRFDPPFRRRP